MAIKIENLSYSYLQPFGEKVEALKNVSCSIADGDFVGIMGHTGCGKTTLLQLLAGLRAPTSGQIYVNGEEINAKGYDKSSLRQTVGVVFQNPEYQLFATTVEKDVAFGLKHSGLSRQEVTARVQWALETMGFDFAKIRSQSPLALSGGEKRRVAIAGVLARKPEILLFDEPIAGLDPYGRENFLRFVGEINQAGTTVLMVSHNMEALAEYTKHLLVLEQGRLIDSGPTREVFVRLKQRKNGAFGQTKAQKIATLLAEVKLPLSSGVVTYADLLSALKQELTGGGRG
ncbi:MAG TPA: energy-coupling factor transporter ATPase [Firmicutes bacterium]|jgi:energy-coupling factor transport system ATP-binding protein|nr:energy-coupling factor transporter ATPase [Bacillota bacterium]